MTNLMKEDQSFKKEEINIEFYTIRIQNKDRSFFEKTTDTQSNFQIYLSNVLAS
jgi:hypothetical protein